MRLFLLLLLLTLQNELPLKRDTKEIRSGISLITITLGTDEYNKFQVYVPYRTASKARGAVSSLRRFGSAEYSTVSGKHCVVVSDSRIRMQLLS